MADNGIPIREIKTFPWRFPGEEEIEAFDLEEFHVFALRVPDTHQMVLIDYKLKEVFMSAQVRRKSTPNTKQAVTAGLKEYSESPWCSPNYEEYIEECKGIAKTFDLRVRFEGGERSKVIFERIPL